jgi:hypothetical protein
VDLRLLKPVREGLVLAIRAGQTRIVAGSSILDFSRIESGRGR